MAERAASGKPSRARSRMARVSSSMTSRKGASRASISSSLTCNLLAGALEGGGVDAVGHSGTPSDGLPGAAGCIGAPAQGLKRSRGGPGGRLPPVHEPAQYETVTNQKIDVKGVLIELKVHPIGPGDRKRADGHRLCRCRTSIMGRRSSIMGRRTSPVPLSDIDNGQTDIDNGQTDIACADVGHR